MLQYSETFRGDTAPLHSSAVLRMSGSSRPPVVVCPRAGLYHEAGLKHSGVEVKAAYHVVQQMWTEGPPYTSYAVFLDSF